MKVSVIGTGYVGLSTATVFAELGNEVVAADVDQKKIDGLNNGIMPIFEPGLKEMVQRNVQEGRLKFTADNKDAIKHGEILFICVGTPPKENGEADLKYVEMCAREVAETMDEYKIIVHKSTVPVETGEKMRKIIQDNCKHNVAFDVVSNPEFLREGTAITDTLQPDRIVIGTDSEKAAELMKKLYSPIKGPFIVTDIRSAELIKHASNSFLAMKISYANSLARVCDLTGADVEKVVEGMGLDTRIGPQFLHAGIGYGGFCFPKDVQAFDSISDAYGFNFGLLKATHEINQTQPDYFLNKIFEHMPDLQGKKIAVLGLAFKPNTDDMRFAPSIPIIKALQAKGATVHAFDPQAMERAKEDLPDITYEKSAYETCQDADALVVLTEWNEFQKLDFKKLKGILKTPIVFDGRNLYNPKDMIDEEFQYISMGRKTV